MFDHGVQARLQATNQELEQTTRELAQFSYAVSHDLRAPLRAIDGFSRLLLAEHEDKLDPEAHRMLETVRRNAQHMGRLIDDLLAYVRAGRSDMETVAVDLGSLMRNVVHEVQMDDLEESGERERKVTVTIGDLPPVRGDRTLLRQAMVNLVGNAFKFTRRRSDPRVEIGSTTEQDETVCYVKDNGVGFDMQFAGKLFGVFERLHSPDEFEGTGVGLALVQRIMQRHGGRVWGKGEEGRGATFYFTLPAQR